MVNWACVKLTWPLQQCWDLRFSENWWKPVVLALFIVLVMVLLKANDMTFMEVLKEIRDTLRGK